MPNILIALITWFIVSIPSSFFVASIFKLGTRAESTSPEAPQMTVTSDYQQNQVVNF